jgi:hypothetical protein
MVSFERIIEKLPSITPRDKDANIVNFTDAFSEEIDDFGVTIDDVRQSHFINQASGTELDIIGEQYGILGGRDGRSDEEYRQYLKSLVPVFRFKGTVPGIRAAVGAGLDINDGINSDEQDVFIKERFEENPPTDEAHLEYTIVFENWTPHRGSTVEELSQLSDASMAKLRRAQYNIDTDTTVASDDVTVEEAKFVSDTTVTSDTITPDKNIVVWEQGDWESMHWAAE